MDFLLRDWVMPGAFELCVLVAIGVVSTFAQYGLVRAYSIAQVSTMAPFEYRYMVWAVLFGYIFWGEVPAVISLCGMALLVGSNLYIFYREQQLAKISGNQL